MLIEFSLMDFVFLMIQTISKKIHNYFLNIFFLIETFFYAIVNWYFQ